jgi:bacterioferritin
VAPEPSAAGACRRSKSSCTAITTTNTHANSSTRPAKVVDVRRDAEITTILNDVLTAELTSVNQYFVDAKMMENWGYDPLAQQFRDESIDEMKDADELIGRILFLEGVPNLQRLGTVRVGETVPEKLQLALDLEYESIERLNLASPGVASSATTAPASCSTTSSRARKTTPTGWRPNSGSWRSSARRTTSLSTSAARRASPRPSCRTCNAANRRCRRASPRPRLRPTRFPRA